LTVGRVFDPGGPAMLVGESRGRADIKSRRGVPLAGVGPHVLLTVTGVELVVHIPLLDFGSGGDAFDGAPVLSAVDYRMRGSRSNELRRGSLFYLQEHVLKVSGYLWTFR
jgi:hypothetical protein